MNQYEFSSLNPEERTILLDVPHNTILRQCLNRAKEAVKQQRLDLNPESFNDSDFKLKFAVLKERELVLNEFQDFLELVLTDFQKRHL